MASKTSLPEEDFTCPVCCDIFKDPVVLLCSHSICKECLQKFWEHRKCKECPVCRRKSSMDEPPLNLSLKNLCEAFLKEKSERAAGGSEVLCSLHGERLKLFCLEDKQPICVVCQASRKHSGHQFLPIDEAAGDYKEQLKEALECLEAKLCRFEMENFSCNSEANRIKVQAQQSERSIKEEFKKLHQFLNNEEETRIKALQEEERQKSLMMKEKIEEMNKHTSSLRNAITAIEKQMRAEDIILVQNFKTTSESFQCTMPDPETVSGALIDVAKHLGNLKFRVWEKMKDIVQYTPVVFDPNTAHPSFVISEDLTSLENRGVDKTLPKNPERIACEGVLGSEGFTSGSHCWDVKVKGNACWEVGVTTDSSMRPTILWDRRQAWSVGYGVVRGFLDKLHVLKQDLHTIRVHLDLDKGQVSFSDPIQNTHIHTFKRTFTKKVIPFFRTSYPLSIVPVKTVIDHYTA